MPFLKSLDPPIPMTDGLDVLTLLTDSATIARWSNENLPMDRISIENAMILTNAERWPLMIDPQLQGVKWIKTREGEALKVVRLGQKGYLDAIERAVAYGDCLLLENIGETVDAVLDPLIGRLTIKKGRWGIELSYLSIAMCRLTRANNPTKMIEIQNSYSTTSHIIDDKVATLFNLTYSIQTFLIPSCPDTSKWETKR